MNTQLNPPPVPPLSPSQRSRLRNRVMDQASPTAGRSAWRWAAPVIAIGGVAAVVAGTLIVTNNPTTDPGVTGTATPGVSPAAGAPKVDRGAVPATLVPQLFKECQWPNETEHPKLLWTRHVRGITSNSTSALAVAVQPKKVGPPPTAGPTRGKPTRGGPSSTTTAFNLGVRLCVTRTPSPKRGPLGSIIVVADKLWTSRPTAAQGLLAFPTIGSDFVTKSGALPSWTRKGIPDPKAKDSGTLQTWTLYRARPEIARVEARSVWNGKFGEWTEGVVDNGFAYTEVQVDGMFGHSDQLKQEVRAFDADGKPVPVQL
jgi:hypothetical protein